MDQSYTLLSALLVGGFVLLFKEGGGAGACLLDLYCTDEGVTVAVALGEFLIWGREAGPVLVGLEDAGSGLEDAGRDVGSLTELVGLCGGGRDGPLVGGLGGGRLGLETECPLVTFLP